MNKLLIFGGTTEGRKIIEYLNNKPVDIYAYVATKYGEQVLSPQNNLTVFSKRLNENDILLLLSDANLTNEDSFSLVIDATHPYAKEVTANIKNACLLTNTPYIRIIRDSFDGELNNSFSTIKEAVTYLNTTVGNIFVSTGSKELEAYTLINDYKKRLFIRVLPSIEALELAHKIGLDNSHIICMQGPFSEELNTAQLREVSAKYLVTKDSGKEGGFLPKLNAAKNANAKLLLIKRPEKEDGLSLTDALTFLDKTFSLMTTAPTTSFKKPILYLIGMGAGSYSSITLDAINAIEKSEIIFGAKRLLDSIPANNTVRYPYYLAKDIENVLLNNKNYNKIAILFSGDTSFYSGAKNIVSYFNNNSINGDSTKYDIRILPGISSLSYFCSRLKLSLDDAAILSLHGKDAPLISTVSTNEKTFLLTGGTNTVEHICFTLINNNLGDVIVSVGEFLSYNNEKITTKAAKFLINNTFSSLCVIYIYNPNYHKLDTLIGLPDEAFIRGKVPMTKSEIRAITLSKLRPEIDSVIYDIGAGTGSVTVELARTSYLGQVYAIEQKEDAINLINENVNKFNLQNVTIIHGIAPLALCSLPTPTHAFIGGSSSLLFDIIKVLLDKNPNISIVINCVTLETVSETLRLVHELSINLISVTQASISHSKTLSNDNNNLHLMSGENPVFIMTLKGNKEANN